MSENAESGQRVVVDRALCGILGICELQAPTYFEVLEDGTLQVAEHRISVADLGTVRGAVESCPNRALRLESADVVSRAE